MKTRSNKPGQWMGLVTLLFLGTSFAFAQGPKGTSSPPPAKGDPTAPVVQPSRTPGGAGINSKEYVIGANDVLDIDVWREKEISRTIPVRPDGKISLPLIGEIQASGLTPTQLQSDIQRRLKAYLENPEVTVIVNDPRSHTFNIVGEVNRPGSYSLNESMTVLDSIALAGGFRSFAKENKIYVLRPMPGGIRVRIPFNYKEVIQGRHLRENVPLKPGDTVVVP